MESKELKPPLKLEEQVDLLISRGLIISDADFAVTILGRVNYYRLSAYSLGLRENNVFFEGTTFEQIYQLYEFDKKLRHVMLAAIESFEINFRTQIAYYFAMDHGSMSYLDANLFFNTDHHNSFISEFEREKEWQKENAFVKHHNQVYDGDMPIWVAVELFSFGMLSKLYRNLKARYQKQFVRMYLKKPKDFNAYLISWLRCLVEIRNICAHYGRIYNRILSSKPKLLPQYKNMDLRPRRIFPMLIVIVQLLGNHTDSTMFIINIKALIDQYSAVNLSFIGFPDNWEEILKEARN